MAGFCSSVCLRGVNPALVLCCFSAKNLRRRRHAVAVRCLSRRFMKCLMTCSRGRSIVPVELGVLRFADEGVEILLDY